MVVEASNLVKIFRQGGPTEWSPQPIKRLKNISNPIFRVVNFKVDRILEGYITDFFVDTITSYSEVERKIFQGPIGIYLTSLRIWIKMLVCEKGILRMESNE